MILYIGLGSFFGGVARYLLSQAIQSKAMTIIPYGTMVVNVLGCFLIGFVFAFSEKGYISQEIRLLLATGLLGGFTTFSAFSNETVGMLREGQFTQAAAYVMGSVALGLLGTWAGLWLGKAGG